MMGGPAAVRKAAAGANAQGGLANWRWTLRLTSLLLDLDAIRQFLGTPNAQALTAASVDENLQFVHYLIDPRKAEGLRQSFTLAVDRRRPDAARPRARSKPPDAPGAVESVMKGMKVGGDAEH